MKAPDTLKAAIAHMEARAAQYDKPEGERSMAATVDAFNAITGHLLTERDGWLLMVVLKLVRSQTARGAALDDSVQDAAAYVALMGEP